MQRTIGNARRRAAALAVILAIALVGVAPAIARGDTYRHRMFEIINRARRDHDLRPVRLNLRLASDALHWSRVMLRKNRIYDPPDLTEIFSSYKWTSVAADSVGCGATLYRVHRSMMRDSAHRAIILHPKVRRVGIGIVRADARNRCGRGSFWVSEFYYG